MSVCPFILCQSLFDLKNTVNKRVYDHVLRGWLWALLDEVGVSNYDTFLIVLSY